MRYKSSLVFDAYKNTVSPAHTCGLIMQYYCSSPMKVIGLGVWARQQIQTPITTCNLSALCLQRNARVQVMDETKAWSNSRISRKSNPQSGWPDWFVWISMIVWAWHFWESFWSVVQRNFRPWGIKVSPKIRLLHFHWIVYKISDVSQANML